MKEKEPLLISACLLGLSCRYDGKSVPAADVTALERYFTLVPVCPEIYGGLPTPRLPAERVGERVLRCDGADVTEEYRRGARAALELCRLLHIRVACLKEKSPSCGHGRIYDGTHSGTLTDGDGVTAELLLQAGVRVCGESGIPALLREREKAQIPAPATASPKPDLPETSPL